MPTDGPAWSPGTDATAAECDRCGTAVSKTYRRVWAVDGILDGCRNCLPRSVRFSNGDLASDAADIDSFDPDAPNRGKDHGGTQ